MPAAEGTVPHLSAGAHPYLMEFADGTRLPFRSHARRAEALYPEYQSKDEGLQAEGPLRAFCKNCTGFTDCLSPWPMIIR